MSLMNFFINSNYISFFFVIEDDVIYLFFNTGNKETYIKINSIEFMLEYYQCLLMMYLNSYIQS